MTRPPPLSAPNAGLKWILPIGRSGFAIAAGYLALFSVFLLPAPLAVLFGVLALADIAKHPGKSGKGRAWFGIIVGMVFTLLLLLFLLVVLKND